jgi:uncharacterized SAM-binding protein YcdF (DUF218 family)
MANILKEEWQTPATWIEELSKTTQENAELSFKILQKDHIKDIYLVTQYWHMPRAKRIFEKYGFRVIPAPTGYEFDNEYDLQELGPLDFLPSPSGFEKVRNVWHEVMGMLWYQVRYNS